MLLWDPFEFICDCGRIQHMTLRAKVEGERKRWHSFQSHESIVGLQHLDDFNVILLGGHLNFSYATTNQLTLKD